MKELTLNYKVWRCGGTVPSSNPKNCHGEGVTALLNKNGYMCCLGQFALQLGADREEIIGRPYPTTIDKKISPLTKVELNTIVGTAFSEIAVDINDDDSTTIPEKIKALKKLCKKYKYKLKVINLPKRVKDELGEV